ncbi:phage holin family protein [Thermomonas paludicola]|uniref:phage holin family protein n=1 Tax=Thermomonas paludicola TaxID=2884874 RepID=UPI002114B640|nr:phage holin family protein [Thermomonas paludicola]
MTGDAQADDAREDAAAPDVGETLHALGEGARASARSALGTGRALRALVAADLALARSALARTLAFGGVAVALGGSSWLLLMAAFIAALRSTGLSWLAALLLAALVSSVGTLAAAWAAMRHFEHSGMHATRRQLAKLGAAAARTAAKQESA